MALQPLKCSLVGVLLCCDGNKLLGGLGNVISTLDDLLGDQLHVRSRAAAALRRDGLPALVLETRCTEGQQAQSVSDRLGARLLQRNVYILEEIRHSSCV